MSSYVPPSSITSLADGQTAIAAHLKDLAASIQAWANGNVGNINVSIDPTEKIAYSKLALSGAIVDADIASITFSKFTTLKATAQASPNNTVQVAAGKYLSLSGQALRSFAGGNSPVFPNTAGAGLNRIDLLGINDSAVLVRTAGVESVSPSPPNYPTNQVPICEVYIRFNAVGIVIKDVDDAVNSYISNDARSLLKFTGVADGSITMAKLAEGPTGVVIAEGTTDLADPGTSFVTMTDLSITSVLFGGIGASTLNKGLIIYEGAIELNQGTSTNVYPEAEIRVMKELDGGGFFEVKRTAVDLRTLLYQADATIEVGPGPIVVPVSILAPYTPGNGTNQGFRVEWRRVGTGGTPTIRQPGVTYKRSLTVLNYYRPPGVI